MRREKLATGEYYHVLNRGFDKKEIFRDDGDIARFFQSMEEFNSIDPIGSIYENYLLKKKNGPPRSKKRSKNQKLVDFAAYCLNPNHYHFLVRQTVDDGIKKFLQRLGAGYTKYFNHKYQRIGYLFQGPYKLVHVNSNEYLLHLSVYINLNDRVHKLGPRRSKSSRQEYMGGAGNNKSFCGKKIILDQFSSVREYKEFCEYSLESILARKDMEKLLIE